MMAGLWCWDEVLLFQLLVKLVALDSSGGFLCPSTLTLQLAGIGLSHQRIFGELEGDVVSHVALEVHLGGVLDAKQLGVKDTEVCSSPFWKSKPRLEEFFGRVVQICPDVFDGYCGR